MRLFAFTIKRYILMFFILTAYIILITVTNTPFMVLSITVPLLSCLLITTMLGNSDEILLIKSSKISLFRFLWTSYFVILTCVLLMLFVSFGVVGTLFNNDISASLGNFIHIAVLILFMTSISFLVRVISKSIYIASGGFAVVQIIFTILDQRWRYNIIPPEYGYVDPFLLPNDPSQFILTNRLILLVVSLICCLLSAVYIKISKYYR